MGTSQSMTSTPLSIMSGNFDFPPASSESPSAAQASIDSSTLPGRLQHLRQALQRDRERDIAARETAASDRERQNVTVEVAMPSRRSRGRRARDITESRDRASRERIERQSAARLPPPAFTPRLRTRAVPGERFQSLRRSRIQREQINSMAALDEATDRLAEVNSDLVDLLTPPLLSLGTLGSSSRRTPPSELDGLLRRPKRRKLEHDSDGLSFENPKYGHFGQVVPGRLRMEIVSCDGGQYTEQTSSSLYRPENVLKNDRSVYCTKSSRCNLLLKHQGETPFCLEKVVIKAPERGFTAPVQEGMIFVSMSSDDLLSGTAGYQIDYSNQSGHHSSNSSTSSQDEEELSLTESLTDPAVWAASRLGRAEALDHELDMEAQRIRWQRSRRVLRDRLMQEGSRPPPLHEHPTEYPTNASINTTENCDWPVVYSNQSSARVSAPTPPPFTVTTESDGDSSEDEQPSAAVLRDRLRRDSQWRLDTDDEDDDARVAALWEGRDGRFGSSVYLRAARRSTPSRIEPEDASPEADGLIPPHARFFIAKHKNKITVRFDPPVSGKFVLLKLWSPLHNGNIDIESVLFHGYSGPRYFPACQMR